MMRSSCKIGAAPEVFFSRGLREPQPRRIVRGIMGNIRPGCPVLVIRFQSCASCPIFYGDLMMPFSSSLPILPFRDRIVDAINQHRHLVISAPPGSGKSTCVPQFFLDADRGGSIVVLQPRRIAARQLAAWVARSRNEPVGGTVGYRVRFDSRVGDTTRLTYETYGVFLKRLLSDPLASRISLVILDEFHERTIETDLIFAWLKRLQDTSATSPALIVMSATFEEKQVSRFLDDAPHMDVPGKLFPVAITFQPPQPHEPMERQAVRALEGILGPEMDGSVLIFMPGAGEIRSTIALAEPACKRHGCKLFALHGRLTLEEQSSIIDTAGRESCVIVSTNVAETSLTIPGITVIVDSGYERRAAYDPARDRNTLYVMPISASSATQRAGRAGRIAPGRCIRLWPAHADRDRPSSAAPEITRLELSFCALAALGVLAKSGFPAQGPLFMSWLTPPPAEQWDHALQVLADLEAIDRKGPIPTITDVGQRLLAMPVAPLPARILVTSEQQNIATLSAAVIAFWESDNRSGPADLLDAALGLISGPAASRVPNEIRMAFDALGDCLDPAIVKKERRDLKRILDQRDPNDLGRLKQMLASTWIIPLRRRLAVRVNDTGSYMNQDGKTVTLGESIRTLPEAIIALNTLETAGGGKGRTQRVQQFIPVEVQWIENAFPSEISSRIECTWDEKRQIALVMQQKMLGGAVLRQIRDSSTPEAQEAAASMLAEKLASGEFDLRSEEVMQFVFRSRCTAKAFPDRGFPEYTDEDWQLIYHDFARGKTSHKDLENGSLLTAVKEYAGARRAAEIERLAPTRIKLPSGRTGRVTYFDGAPPELSARIGDFVGMKGKFTLCEGRVQGTFNILAPNMRTVQKTTDLGSFWQNAYPQIRSELKRKYPKHPWP